MCRKETLMDASNLHLLLDNAAILIASTIFYQVSTYINETYDQSSEVFDAFLFGVIGIFIMSLPYSPAIGLNIDTRSILIGLIAYIFGGKTSYFLMILLSIYRLVLGGDGAFIGVIIILVSGLIGFLFRKLNTKTFRLYSVLNFFLLGLSFYIFMTFSIMFMAKSEYVYAFKLLAIPLLIIFPVTTVIVGKLFMMQREQVNQLQLTRFAEKRFRSLFEQAQIGICYLDVNGNLINTNDYFNKMFQYSTDEIK